MNGQPAGYYSYDIGDWHIVMLNSECGPMLGCGSGSPEETWLANDLATHPNACVLATWHEPLFSDGPNGNEPQYQAFWNDLLRYHADVVLNGHDHDYERFVPQNANGAASSTGVTEFVVGTGGVDHEGVGSVNDSTSAVHDNNDFGVLEMTLHPSSFGWKFVTTSGQVFDSGSTACNAKGTSITSPGAPTAVSAIAGNAAATVSWTAPGNGGGADHRLHRHRIPGGATATTTGATTRRRQRTDQRHRLHLHRDRHQQRRYRPSVRTIHTRHPHRGSVGSWCSDGCVGGGR